MANPLSFPSLVQFVARLADRVTALERRRAAPVPDSLDDFRDTQILYGHSVSAPADGHVFTWDSSVSTPFGGAWVAAPSVAGEAPTGDLTVASDSGSFSDSTTFYPDIQVAVPARSYMPLVVTVTASASDIAADVVSGGGGYVAVATPWKVTALDATGDPGYTRLYGAMGSRSGVVSFPMWLHNATDDEAVHVVFMTVAATEAFGPSFSGTASVRAEYVASIAALTP